MEPRKQAIVEALSRFIRQRPGLEFGNYGDRASYAAECRGIARDKREAETLLAAVARRDGIDADALIKAATGAFSGRLTIKTQLVDPFSSKSIAKIDYVTGQYFPTEYRRAVCAVLALALWEYTREKAMPEVTSYSAAPWGFRGNPPRFATRADALAFRDDKGGNDWGHISELYAGMSAGDWLRAHFRKEFGRGIASRWFS